MSVFSEILRDKYLYEGRHFFLIYDSYPVSEGHILIVSKRETPDYFSLNKEELSELPNMIKKAKEIVEENLKPDGYNIGMNCGETSGQTVMHFHCHLMPRYDGDVENPRGGVRHSVIGKGYY